MGVLLSGFGAALALLCASSLAHGQKATEQYIPIGQSPGVSHKYSSIGAVAGVNPAAQTITIADPGGPRTVRITDKTRIWLDRTKLQQTNVPGSFADLRAGRRVEVKYADPARRDVADWVKVEISQP
jgi:hypothetical protein